MKRKRKKKKCDNLIFVSVLEEYCPDLMAKFTFVKETPVKFSIKTFGKMPFKLIDKTWERYGIARVYDISESSEVPILECWYPPNTIRVESPAKLEEIHEAIFGHLPPESRQQIEQFHQKHKKRQQGIECEGLMTYLGSIFMRTVGIALGREREYQIYMNSVSPIQIPVEPSYPQGKQRHVSSTR